MSGCAAASHGSSCCLPGRCSPRSARRWSSSPARAVGTPASRPASSARPGTTSSSRSACSAGWTPHSRRCRSPSCALPSASSSRPRRDGVGRPCWAVCLLVVTVVASWVFELYTGDTTGTYWQGRYSLPLLVGIPMMLALGGVNAASGRRVAVAVGASAPRRAQRGGVGRRPTVGRRHRRLDDAVGLDTSRTPLPPIVVLAALAALSIALAAVLGPWTPCRTSRASCHRMVRPARGAASRSAATRGSRHATARDSGCSTGRGDLGAPASGDPVTRLAAHPTEPGLTLEVVPRRPGGPDIRRPVARTFRQKSTSL